MITVSSIRDIDDSTKEGKMLMAALSVLTSISHEQIDEHEYGGHTHPDDATERIANLANYIYYTEEYKRLELVKESSIKRDNTIDNIIDDTE